MPFEQQLNVNQTQQQRFTQGLQQSVRILQQGTPAMLDYLTQKSMDNPLMHLSSSPLPLSSLGDAAAVAVADTTHNLLDYLYEQITLTMRPTVLRDTVLKFLPYLDEIGYLRNQDQLATQLNIDTVTMADAVTLLQQLDPPGIGAQNLQECLRLQLLALYAESPSVSITHALAIVTTQYVAFTSNQRAVIAERLALTPVQVQSAYRLIARLDPAPGRQVTHRTMPIIIPDLVLEPTTDGYRLHLSKWANVKVGLDDESLTYLKTSAIDGNTQRYVAQKQKEVETLQSAVQKRRQTLLLVGQAVIDRQADFFFNQKPIRPILLRDIANALGFNESTISRALHDKFIRSPRGTHALKDFFQSRNKGARNQDLLTPEQQALKQMIAGESSVHPLSDQAISQQLASIGITLSRRMVTKYREQLNIPSSRKRKC